MSISGAIQSGLRGGASLEKLQIRSESEPEPIHVLFNPHTLRYSKSVNWKIAPITGQSTLAGYHQVTFCASNPRTLDIELFFDTYEGEPPAWSGGAVLQQALAAVTPMNPLDRTPSGSSVMRWTAQVANLAAVQPELHQPPLCQLWWGDQCLFRGVLTNLTEDFTMFLPDGTPVRATLACTFTEAVDPVLSASQIRELQSADILKTRVLRRGDTLSGLALELYNDASRWRLIADANQIVDPRRLEPLIGTALIIPRAVG